jgi:hypothetical protein
VISNVTCSTSTKARSARSKSPAYTDSLEGAVPMHPIHPARALGATQVRVDGRVVAASEVFERGEYLRL